MAGFRTHITVSGICGVGFGAAAVNPLHFPTETAVLAAAVTTAGGMLPDLDSGPGRPVRELSALAAAVVPLLAAPRLAAMGLTHEGTVVTLLTLYVSVRYGLSWLVKRLSVHRGMFHSIPAMLISGLIVYLDYGSPDRPTRVLLAVGVMIGFLSHLVLDEIYSVDLSGFRPKLKSSAGSALKFFSSSVYATMSCYALLGALGYMAYLDYHTPLQTAVNAFHHQR